MKITMRAKLSKPLNHIVESAVEELGPYDNQEDRDNEKRALMRELGCFVKRRTVIIEYDTVEGEFAVLACR